MTKLKAIIIDDEEASRETLHNYLKKYCEDDVQVMAKADAVKTGLQEIAKHQPDIVFLDIEMPYGNGFDLLDQIEDVNFEVVFVTAFKDYAIKALNMSAAYYLLKPVAIEELVNAVQKIKESKANHNEAFHTRILMDNIKSAHKQMHKIVLPQLDGFEVVQVKDIIRGEAADNFTQFYMADGSKHLICRTLKYFDELLADFDFIRVHKSHLVNFHYITQYKKGKGGQVKMSDGTFVDVSAARKKELLERFN